MSILTPDDGARLFTDEYLRARMFFPKLRSPHEGYAILKEEVDELWDAIKANDHEHALEEVVQVGAMALAFLLEATEEKNDEPR